jgi:hypothetical protein
MWHYFYLAKEPTTLQLQCQRPSRLECFYRGGGDIFLKTLQTKEQSQDLSIFVYFLGKSFTTVIATGFMVVLCISLMKKVSAAQYICTYAQRIFDAL